MSVGYRSFVGMLTRIALVLAVPGAIGCYDLEVPDPPDNGEVDADADMDTDSDGTLDCNDNYPDDPDKTDLGACGCGVVVSPMARLLPVTSLTASVKSASAVAVAPCV